MAKPGHMISISKGGNSGYMKQGILRDGNSKMIVNDGIIAFKEKRTV